MPAAKPGGHPRGRWRRSIRTQGLVAIVVPAVLILAYLSVVLWAAQVNRHSEARLANIQQVVASATSLQADVTSAEANAAGVLLGNGEQSLAAYRQRAGAVPGDLAGLHHLAAGRPELRPALRQVTAGADGMLRDLSILMAQPRPPTDVTTATVTQGGHDDALVLAGVAAMRTQELEAAHAQQEAVDRANTLLIVLGCVAAALVVVGGATLSLLFTTRVAERLRRIAASTDAMARGELPRRPTEADDEIGRLALRLAEASRQLHERERERDRARAELEDLLTASPVVSVRYDAVARAVTYASPNIDRLLGITAGEVCAELTAATGRFHPDDLTRLRHELRGRRHADGDRIEMVIRLRDFQDDTDWREADAVFTVEVDDAGALCGAVAYMIDVTNRHRAERAAEEHRLLLESIFDASPDTITVRDPQGHVVLASRMLASVIGLGNRTEALDADTLVDAAYRYGDISDQDQQELQAILQRCLDGDPHPPPVVTIGRNPDSEAPIYETRARPVVDSHGRVTGTVTVSRDVTDRSRLEASLRDASAAAERASRAKSDFLSRMSHELRTPLNAILGFAQLLQLDELPAEQDSSLQQIQRAGQHLLALINEVLDISRIEAGRLSLSPEPVGVDDVLAEVAGLLGPVAEAGGVRIQTDTAEAGGRYVSADRQRLLQVLLNLGSNAVKYNHRDGTVVFRTMLVDGDRVRFEVSDNGPGIRHDQQDELFQPFSRLGAERSNVEGTGVGLALSKQLVELMGGTIGVESAEDRGSTFWIELLVAPEPPPADRRPSTTMHEADGPGPVRIDPPTLGSGAGTRADAEAPTAPTAPAGPPTPAGPPPAGEGAHAQRTVLHIEDNASNASLVEQVLARVDGLRLLSATHARVGLELARQYHPDLVLLDLHLPDLPGEELLYRLKADPALAGTRIVVVSADATPSRMRRMLALGVDAYLTKPIDIEALLRVVVSPPGRPA